jgi:hypothetical protein
MSFMLASDVVPMESLGGYYHRIASHQRFGSAVKAFSGTLDSLTAHVVALLRSQPLARVIILVYLMSIHALIYLLIARMQHASLHRDLSSRHGLHL